MGGAGVIRVSRSTRWTGLLDKPHQHVDLKTKVKIEGVTMIEPADRMDFVVTDAPEGNKKQVFCD